MKDAEPEEILSAIRQVHEGIARFSPSVAQQLMVSVENSLTEVETALARFRVPRTCRSGSWKGFSCWPRARRTLRSPRRCRSRRRR
ncbi:hypothetical protein [Nesterenkonia pannonica]|uniref:hypothetical protein n=1 Tax=Nesterenkonia pannonica TaxID=1548602 RepID=UPI002164145B|nr:hypothetical protein [Nesterenkonia pannonica]